MYIYCKNCDWSQDDFWSWSYNPLRYFVRESIPSYIWPEIIIREKRIKENGQTVWKRWRVLSWVFLYERLIHTLKAPFKQRWWTYSSWKRAIRRNNGYWPNCPKCKHGRLACD